MVHYMVDHLQFMVQHIFYGTAYGTLYGTSYGIVHGTVCGAAYGTVYMVHAECMVQSSKNIYSHKVIAYCPVFLLSS